VLSKYIISTKRHRRRIRDSRVLRSNELTAIVARLPQSQKPDILINASPCEIYQSHPRNALTEDAPHANTFLAKLAKEWENATAPLAQSLRVVYTRFPTVVGAGGNLWRTMYPIYKLGLGTTIGKGDNWFPWIAVDDVVNIMFFIIANERISGAVNCVSPNMITQKEFSDAFRQFVNRPALMPRIPALFAKLGGELFTEVFLNSKRIVPAKLQAAGCEWLLPDIADALAATRAERR